MRIKARRLVSKRELKEDRFQALVEKVIAAYYRDRQKFWIGAGVVLAVIVGAVLLIQGGGRKDNTEAELRFTEALGILSQGDLQRAEEAFRNVEAGFGRNYVGVKSHYYLGHILYLGQRFDEAKKEFAGFLRGAKGNPVLTPAAHMGVADCDLELGNLLQAAQGYEKVNREFPDWPLAFDAALAAGRAYREAGAYDRAEALYKALLEEGPTGENAERLKVELAYVQALQTKL